MWVVAFMNVWRSNQKFILEAICEEQLVRDDAYCSVIKIHLSSGGGLQKVARVLDSFYLCAHIFLFTVSKQDQQEVLSDYISHLTENRSIFMDCLHVAFFTAFH